MNNSLSNPVLLAEKSTDIGATLRAQALYSSEMESTVKALLAPGKGILAADESLPTIEKRFKKADITCSEENRRDYRELLFTTPGLNKFISGVILFDETIRQRTKDQVPMPEVLVKQEMIPGIKVDRGTIAMAHFAGEQFTQGLDGLRERLCEYRELGARFAKWRAVITIGGHIPSRVCIRANAESLALYAGLCQEAGLVPIVEPEVLMDGPHSISHCEEITEIVLKQVFDSLYEHRVVFEHMILKSGMVLSGAECPQQADVSQVAEATLRCFRNVVPVAMPGIVFLSGGQGDQIATQRMNGICRLGNAPWTLSFSFGRALQAPVIEVWKGLPQNVAAAQSSLHHRAYCNSSAINGKYFTQMENGNS